MEEQGATTPRQAGSSNPAHLIQYITAFSVAVGSFSFGTTLGYTSPAGPLLVSNSTNGSLHLTTVENSLFSSVLNVGALVGGPLGGLVINAIGRRWTMLGTVVILVASWLLIIFGQNFAMLVCGRILAGLYTGVTCVNIPNYIGEISSPDIRGTLGTVFQLMVVTGILFSYVVGDFMTSWRGLAAVCAIPVLIYAVLIVLFVKESPIVLIAKGKLDEARGVLQHFRGKHYDVEPELEVLRQNQEEMSKTKTTLKDLKKSYILKPLIIIVAIMFFQQTSGVNAVLFNLNDIFSSAGTGMDEGLNAIIVGLVQVLATIVATFLCDRLGRKLLLILSSSAMCISLVALDVFFYEKAQDEQQAMDTLGWLPLVSLIVYIAAFSVGYGPIPWVLMGELFTSNVKDAAGAVGIMVNWGTSFFVTLLFQPLQDVMGPFGVYWMFAGFCAVNCVFCILVVPETKGKTLEEITAYFGAPTNSQDTTTTTTTKSQHYDNPVFIIEQKEEENKLEKSP
ncbi:hypothetical protein Pmani_005895 [Petrolisthes manimaculis]|uniref:Major facilitator superfamily (MFS) profile domain-containing protein n=1 Tax=Petrolisthes manimaculis TaxID=1843537 RepID=A0AAE1QBB3_9EUCA|nr:hypothetical protein Pmani_005895 [Petrolisthes manimaculis]